MDRLWEHSLACAYASQTVSEKLKLETHEDAFTLGMLHDIGKLVILKILSEMDNKDAFGEDVDSIELFNSLEGYHGQFGKALLKMWGFSDEFGRVSMHHESLEGVDPISNSLLAVHFANLLVKAMGYGQEESEEIDVENAESTRFLKIELTMISEIEQEVKLLVDDVKESIG